MYHLGDFFSGSDGRMGCTYLSSNFASKENVFSIVNPDTMLCGACIESEHLIMMRKKMIHRQDLERPFLERHNLERHNIERHNLECDSS